MGAEEEEECWWKVVTLSERGLRLGGLAGEAGTGEGGIGIEDGVTGILKVGADELTGIDKAVDSVGNGTGAPFEKEISVAVGVASSSASSSAA